MNGWEAQLAWSGITFHGHRIRQLAEQGAPAKEIRHELETYGWRCGQRALSAGVPEAVVRDRLLDVAERCGDPCAGTAVLRGFRAAVRRQVRV